MRVAVHPSQGWTFHTSVLWFYSEDAVLGFEKIPNVERAGAARARSRIDTSGQSIC